MYGRCDVATTTVAACLLHCEEPTCVRVEVEPWWRGPRQRRGVCLDVSGSGSSRIVARGALEQVPIREAALVFIAETGSRINISSPCSILKRAYLGWSTRLAAAGVLRAVKVFLDSVTALLPSSNNTTKAS